MKTQTIIKWALGRKLFAPKETGLVARWVPSKGASLCVVIGENATGKSLFRRCVGAYCKSEEDKADTEMIGLSMAARTGATGLGVVRGMIYGDESTNSTGVNSAHTVTTGISTARGRSSPHVVFWDEPDTGLSDNYAAGVGQLIADFAEKPGEHTQGIFVVTHRKVLLQQLLRVKPHVVLLGPKAPKTLQEYLTKPIEPADPEKLYKESHELFLKVMKVLKA